MAKTYPVINTQDLIYVNDESIRLGLNRNVHKAIYDKLDPDGIHIAWIHMPHGSEFTPPRAMHYRVLWLLKFKDDDSPHEAYIDTPATIFDKLSRIDSETHEVVA